MATAPFSWANYLTLATELSERAEEHCLRTAISRAYYYVFHLARQRVEDNEFYIAKGENSHRQVWEKFERDPDVRCQKLYIKARQIQDKRKRADYDLTYPKIEAEFPALIDLAKKFAQDLDALDKRLPANTGIKS
jgi:uncharacterized protein (UPF0332 family)